MAKKGKCSKKSAKKLRTERRQQERAEAKARQAELQANPTLGMRLSRWYQGNRAIAWMAAGVIALTAGVAYWAYQDSLPPPAPTPAPVAASAPREKRPVHSRYEKQWLHNPDQCPDGDTLHSFSIKGEFVDICSSFHTPITFNSAPSLVTDEALESLVDSYKTRYIGDDDPSFLNPITKRRFDFMKSTTSMDARRDGKSLVPITERLSGEVQGVRYSVNVHPTALKDLEGLSDENAFFSFVQEIVESTIINIKEKFYGPVEEYVFVLENTDYIKGTFSSTIPVSGLVRMNAERWTRYFKKKSSNSHQTLQSSLEHEGFHCNDYITILRGEPEKDGSKESILKVYEKRPKFWREFAGMVAELDGYVSLTNQKISAEWIQRRLLFQLGAMVERDRIMPGTVHQATMHNGLYDSQATRALAYYAAGVVFESLGDSKRFNQYVAALLHEDLKDEKDFNRINEQFDVQTKDGVLTYKRLFDDTQKLFAQK